MISIDTDQEGIENIKNEFIQQELFEISEMANISEVDTPIIPNNDKFEFTLDDDTIPENSISLHADSVSTELTVDTAIKENDICKNVDIELEIDTVDLYLEYSNIVYSYASVIKEGLDWITFFLKLNELSDKQIARYFLSRFLVFVSYDPSISYGSVLVTLATFIETGKIR